MSLPLAAWSALSLLVGFFWIRRRLSFWTGFLWSMTLSPLAAVVIGAYAEPEFRVPSARVLDARCATCFRFLPSHAVCCGHCGTYAEPA
jgi:hypothetical protein